MTATQHMVGEADRFHRAALRGRDQQRDATLYACEQLHAAGTEPTGPEVRQWLEEHGRRVGRTTVWKAVTEYRREHGLPDLDDGRGLFSGGGVNTEHDSEQTTEQPSGGTNVFTLEQTAPAADPAPADSGHMPEWGSGEHAGEQREPVNVNDETAEQQHDTAVNTVPAASAVRSPAPMADSGHMGTTTEAPAAVAPLTQPAVNAAPAASVERSPAPMGDSGPTGTTGDSPENPENPAAAAPQAQPSRALPTWPVLLMAFPAFIAIWSGWVGLGELTGFGVVHPLPGIFDNFTINSAITLPIGVEAYASYALYVWLSGRIKTQMTRTYAMVSAFASLGIGAAGQVAYHFMEARQITAAPWWIITMVACLPVAVVGMGAVLAHLIIRERHTVNA